MSSIRHGFLAYLVSLFVIACCASCSNSGTDGEAADVSDPVSAAMHEDGGKADTGGTMTSPQAASVMDAIKAMAASQGIHFGEVPEGFPLELLPLYPGGEIDKSNVSEDGFTLLQLVPADKDTAFSWYKKHYAKMGWSDNKLITVAGRTMTGFNGKDARVDMTLIDREEGKTFVALALSPN